MKIHVLPAGPIQTNAYLLTAGERGEAVLIDAPEGVWADVQPILAAEKCKLKELWITHGHFDHIQGVGEVVAATGARVVAHLADQEMMANPAIVRERLGFDVTLEAVHPDAWVAQGDRIDALGVRAEVRHVPGHCPGNVLFYFAGNAASKSAGAAFVGDALFAGSVGRTDLPLGSMAQLTQSIRGQIYTLPDDTVVFPGHGPRTTVGTEKQSNPYVRP
jgi:glyoxylase-like metal-dependent hydrolase (beta-lactamase superfamily II)